jgi:hypothetical protein
MEALKTAVIAAIEDAETCSARRWPVDLYAEAAIKAIAEHPEWRLLPADLTPAMRDAGELVFLKHKHLSALSAIRAIWRELLRTAPTVQP